MARKRGRPRKDYTGVRWGWVQALHPTGQVNGTNAVWLCMCHSCNRTFLRDTGSFSRTQTGPAAQANCGCRNNTRR